MEEIRMTDFWVVGILAGLILIYLIYALMKPEEF